MSSIRLVTDEVTTSSLPEKVVPENNTINNTSDSSFQTVAVTKSHGKAKFFHSLENLTSASHKKSTSALSKKEQAAFHNEINDHHKPSYLKIFAPLRSRSNSNTGSHISNKSKKNISDYVPVNIEELNESASLEWEARANQLALTGVDITSSSSKSSSTARGDCNISDKAKEDLLQQAIDWHENGQLERATKLFEYLAQPLINSGPNIALAQVLYGLSLRHGWGCSIDETRGFEFLRMAASNSALDSTLQADAKNTSFPPGSTFPKLHGEMVLALYELGNCFRQGWGCERNDYAAKIYYETAARLGDADAMVEVAQCYLNGIGAKKDKKKAAQFYRMAEKHGRTEVGNSWIWKEKYN